VGYEIGIDGGTESIRVQVCDLEGGCKASASHPYEIRFAAGSRAEQNPEDWWSSVGLAVRKAINTSGIAPEAIEALALASTCCTVVALDDKPKPLRPAILWMDVRAKAEAEAVLRTADQALQVNCAGKGPVSAE